MAALVLDTGALIAADRNDRALVAKLRVAQRSGLELRSTGIVIAEAWRDEGGRQANLARLLRSVDVRPVDERLGRQAGALLAKSGTRDAADATIVAVASGGDRILTSDPRDIGRLVTAARRAIRVVGC
jgi:predicted nucleic acid-binding protein